MFRRICLSFPRRIHLNPKALLLPQRALSSSLAEFPEETDSTSPTSENIDLTTSLLLEEKPIESDSKLYETLFNLKDFMAILLTFDSIKDLISNENAFLLIRSLSKTTMTLSYHDKHIMRQETSIKLTKVLEFIDQFITEEASAHMLSEYLFLLRLLRKTRLTPRTVQVQILKTFRMIDAKMASEKEEISPNLVVSIYNEATILRKGTRIYRERIGKTLFEMVRHFDQINTNPNPKSIGESHLGERIAFQGDFLTPNSLVLLVQVFFEEKRTHQGKDIWKNDRKTFAIIDKMATHAVRLLHVFFHDIELYKKSILFLMNKDIFKKFDYEPGTVRRFLRLLIEDFLNKRLLLTEKDFLNILKGCSVDSKLPEIDLIHFIKNTSIATIHKAPSALTLDFIIDFLKLMKNSEFAVFKLSENAQILFLKEILSRTRAMPPLSLENEHSEKETKEAGVKETKKERIFFLSSRDQFDKKTQDEQHKRAEVSRRFRLYSRILEVIDPKSSEQMKIAEWILNQVSEIPFQYFHLTAGLVLLEHFCQIKVDCSALFTELIRTNVELIVKREAPVVLGYLYLLDHPVIGEFPEKESISKKLYNTLLLELSRNPYEFIYNFASKYRKASSDSFAKIRQKIENLITRRTKDFINLHMRQKLLLCLFVAGFQEEKWAATTLEFLNSYENSELLLNELLFTYSILENPGNKEIRLILGYLARIKEREKNESQGKILIESKAKEQKTPVRNWLFWFFEFLSRFPSNHLKNKHGYVLNEIFLFFDDISKENLLQNVSRTALFRGTQRLLKEKMDLEAPFMVQAVKACCETYLEEISNETLGLLSHDFVISLTRANLPVEIYMDTKGAFIRAFERLDHLEILHEKKAFRQLELIHMIERLGKEEFKSKEFKKERVEICMANQQNSEVFIKAQRSLFKAKIFAYFGNLGLYEAIEEKFFSSEFETDSFSLQFWNSFIQCSLGDDVLPKKEELKGKISKIAVSMIKGEPYAKNVADFVINSAPLLNPEVNWPEIQRLIKPHLHNCSESHQVLMKQVLNENLSK